MLFECISLVFHQQTEESPLVQQIVGLFGKFLNAKETNLRYLCLDSMAHYASVARNLDPIKVHQVKILETLKDRDISVRRKALDLVYSMCDTDNAKTIVSELLQFLALSDFAIREEMVLKIAILAEKFAPDFPWYVDVILQLIAIAGDHVNDVVRTGSENFGERVR